MTPADVIVALADWLASPGAQVVVSLGKGDAVELRLRDAPPPAGEAPPELRGACAEWTLRPGDDATRLRVILDPARVPGDVAGPDTLYGLHALAARRPDVRFVVHLPPEHVARRR